jgi:Family of unknown function (DUF6526)
MELILEERNRSRLRRKDFKRSESMAETGIQNYANHRRLDPAMHFFVFGVFAVNVLMTLWGAVRNRDLTSIWSVVMASAFVVLFFRVRLYSLQVQDRVIRLEERLRLRARIGELTTRQLIGLRFASDAEVPALVQAALDNRLGAEEIKKKIVSWRADFERV